MAFPTVTQSLTTGNSGGNTTQNTITLPTHAAGDLIIGAFCNDGTATVSVGSGASFNKLTDTASAANRLTTWWFLCTTASHTLRLDTSASESSAWVFMTIDSGTHGTATSNPEQGTAATGNTSTPNPPNLDPSGWGTEDTLWIVAYGWDANVSNSAYPANYTYKQGTDRVSGGAGAGVALAARQLNAASEDPGTATLSASEDWVAATIAVRKYIASTQTLGSTGAARLDGTSVGTRLVKIAGSGAGRLDATSSANMKWGLTGSGAGRLDGTSVGTRLVKLTDIVEF